LAATIFSDDVQDLLNEYKDEVSAALNIRDLDPLLMYLSHFWELLQLNNSVIPISWNETDGISDVVVGNGKFTLQDISNDYGVSILFLEIHTGIRRGEFVPEGMKITFDRTSRWLAIAKWFSDWEDWIISLPDLTRAQKQRMFITHQLHGDLQRTCNSMHDIIHHYVVGNVNRRWIPKRFSQDPVESFFSQIRQSAGGNVDTCRKHVDNHIRSTQWKYLLARNKNTGNP
jgi:hypothetical protein